MAEAAGEMDHPSNLRTHSGFKESHRCKKCKVQEEMVEGVGEEVMAEAEVMAEVADVGEEEVTMVVGVVWQAEVLRRTPVKWVAEEEEVWVRHLMHLYFADDCSESLGIGLEAMGREGRWRSSLIKWNCTCPMR